MTKTRGDVSTPASAEATRSSRLCIPAASSSASPSAPSRTPSALIDSPMSSERRGREVEHLDVERTRLAASPSTWSRRDGADVAELLHDDHVGLDLRPPLLLDRVERPAVPRRLGDDAVDLAARQVAGLDQRRGDDRLRRRLRRPVALVRDADDLSPRPRREEDLGRGGDERADPHAIQATRAARDEADLAARLQHGPADLGERGDLLQARLGGELLGRQPLPAQVARRSTLPSSTRISGSGSKSGRTRRKRKTR